MESKILSAYRINNQVDFYPHENKLVSCKTAKEIVTYVTSSRCLALLISQQGQMVTHNALYEAGWENHGKIVTPNTLYQTISKLRKQLQEAGLTEEIIQTYPRQGWSLSEATVIKERIVGPTTKNRPQQPDSQSGLKDFCKKLFGIYPRRILFPFARIR